MITLLLLILGIALIFITPGLPDEAIAFLLAAITWLGEHKHGKGYHFRR